MVRNKIAENALKFYQIIYNFLLFSLHFIALIDVIYEKFKKHSFNYSNHHNFMQIITCLQLFDLIHSFLGWTKTNIRAGLLQIFGRLLILWFLKQTYQLWAYPTTWILLIAYCIIECIRYPYYISKLVNFEMITISWLRYNSFLILYPIGFISEAITIAFTFYYMHYGKKHVYKYYGTEIDLVLFFMPIIIMSFPYIVKTLFTHMLAQRNKKNKEIYKKIR